MKNNKAMKIIILVLPGIVALSVIIAAVMSFSLEEPPLSLYGAKDLNSGWRYIGSQSKYELVSLPGVILANNNTVTIENSLPTALDLNSVLGIKLLYQKLRVFVDDRLIYEIGYNEKTPFGSAFGYLWNFIPLRDDYAGKKLTLVYTSPLKVSHMNIEGILLGNESAMFMEIVRNNIFLLILCAVLMIAGVLYLTIRLLLQFKYPQAKWTGITYLSIFFMLTVVWLFTDSDLTQFISDGRTFFYLASFYSFMILPIPFLLFKHELCSENHPSLLVLAALFSLNVIVCTLLYIFNIFDLIQTICTTHILMLNALLFGGWVCFREIKQKNTSMHEIAIGTVFLIIGGFISIFQYYFYSTDFTFAFKCGLLVFVLYISVAAIKKYLLILNESISAEAYKKLAYTDSLSGLGNRHAFSETVELLDEWKAKHLSIALLVFDIDNLKPVNDKFGHAKGDEMIKAVSHCLSVAFSDVGKCFRIGGDEFAAVITDVDEREIRNCLNRLQKIISIHSEESTGSIGLSIGFEYCGADDISTLSIYEIYCRADEKMYKDKRSKDLPIKR